MYLIEPHLTLEVVSSPSVLVWKVSLCEELGHQNRDRHHQS